MAYRPRRTRQPQSKHDSLMKKDRLARASRVDSPKHWQEEREDLNEIVRPPAEVTRVPSAM